VPNGPTLDQQEHDEQDEPVALHATGVTEPAARDSRSFRPPGGGVTVSYRPSLRRRPDGRVTGTPGCFFPERSTGPANEDALGDN